MLLRCDATTVANIRLSHSPIMEAVWWLNLAARGGRHPVFGDTGALARDALGAAAVDLVTDLLAPEGNHYTPDLLTPQPRPGAPAEVFQAQLADLAGSSAEAVLTQLRYAEDHWGRPVSTRVRRLAEAGTLAGRLAEGIETFWRLALAEGWHRIEALAEADLNDRAKTLATRGVGALLSTLDPKCHWTGSAVTVDKPYPVDLDLSGQAIVLAPSVLSWPKFMLQCDDKRQVALYYPAARIGLRGRRDPAELARVVGATRAALLADLDAPRSTAELAGRHELAAATVSYHLGALRRTGLVTARRDGRFVLYQRSAQADALLAAS
ncbi:winged helix-turn-helix domain-containing protein [Crossiella sp. SN42]|uniref:ArsR/SmtB family transcription factor n=1 Tax=Crossiella sp. SN42 TaxID=2944808 RepID=UPI00207D5EA4|nr:winged helix-turn-helix domain-containing protein [Crossiella sp. SN42]MCO1577091.1 winged helix-turn-helix domain-containing protein [Crossiella sp. SN42]